MAHIHGIQPSNSSLHKRKLKIVLIMTFIYLVAEVAGGIITQSLALLADAGHMLTDAGGLLLALLAIRYGERKPDRRRTFGYYRAEILAALTNAVVLIVISFFILYEAYQRFLHPPEVATTGMMLVAVTGLLVNSTGILVLRKDSGASLNMKAAYFEVLSDALTSIAVIAAGLIMQLTGWYAVDSVLSAGIGLFILPRTWGLLRASVNVLLEAVPGEIDLVAMRTDLLNINGVCSIHDLHVWSLTSGVNMMSTHLVHHSDADAMQVLRDAQELLEHRYHITHTTIQTEQEGAVLHEKELHP
ncbi:cation transporter [Niabella ginsenosidivorans]|uniref:Cation transporter n=1 Tax=Niabella ginsenosidivorans TaxID=1176587 RepID=A0A1A9I146_9BACT|nr:cation diffusion facilitator family transporter [Niabella ginsenosidivorans]ANH81378.1 cation transporter [Niabella ginsenosidivorans]